MARNILHDHYLIKTYTTNSLKISRKQKEKKTRYMYTHTHELSTHINCTATRKRRALKKKKNRQRDQYEKRRNKKEIKVKKRKQNKKTTHTMIDMTPVHITVHPNTKKRQADSCFAFFQLINLFALRFRRSFVWCFIILR